MNKSVFFIIAALILTVSTTFIIPAESDNSEVVKELYNAGGAALNKREYDKARDLFIKAISYNDKLPEVHAKLGDAYMALKEDELGCESYKKCVEIINNMENLSNEILKLFEDSKGKIKKFRMVEDKISALKDDFAVKLMAIGRTAMDNNDLILSSDIFTLVLRLNIDNTEASENIEKIAAELEKEGKDNPSVEEPELARAFYSDGVTLFKQSKYNEALIKFDKAISYQFDSPQILAILGDCHVKLKNNTKAIKNYRLALKCLQQKNNRSKEDDDIFSRVSGELEKIDARQKDFIKAKNDYVSKALSAVNDCLSKKYQRVAYSTIKQVNLLDPANKKAAEYLAKIDPKITQVMQADVTTKKDEWERKGTVKRLFNGKDLTGWKCSPGAWSIKNGLLEAKLLPAMGPQVMLWESAAPENYIVTVKFTPGKQVEAKLPTELGCIYNYDEGQDYFFWGFVRYHVMASGLNTLEFIVKDRKYHLILNNELIYKDNTSSYNYPKMGLYIKNLNATFSSVTLQELK